MKQPLPAAMGAAKVPTPFALAPRDKQLRPIAATAMTGKVIAGIATLTRVT